MANKVLITGMSGLIGGVLRNRLEDGPELVALNRSAVEGVTTTRADLADYAAIRPAFDGVDTIVHLAAKAGEQFTWDELLDTNIVGTRNVFEAAADAGCRRVVFASSGATISGWEAEDPYKALVEARYDDVEPGWTMIRHDMATRPAGVYGATKVWGEALARRYVDSFDLSILCIRIGYVNSEDRPSADRHFAVWCSQRDIGDVLERCVLADDVPRYDVLFANSGNRWGYRDLEHTRDVLGWEPRDNAETHR